MYIPEETLYESFIYVFPIKSFLDLNAALGSEGNRRKRRPGSGERKETMSEIFHIPPKS